MSEFPVAKMEHLKVFIGYNSRNLYRLRNSGMVIVEDEIIRLKGKKIDSSESKNILITLDVLVHYYKKGYITKELDYLKTMDMPYYAMAKSSKVDNFIYFAVVNIGKELLQSKLIDNDNNGNVVIIIEEKSQKEDLDLKVPIARLEIYKDLCLD